MSRLGNKYVIGLTGNIAVGKSVVRQMAQHLGAYPIDADGLAHQAMAPNGPAYKPIVETFGQFILDGEKQINRAMLGSIVFSNPEALAKLEAITHPIVRQAINIMASRAKQPIIIIEAIKLLEGELAQLVDEVWVVNASPETQYRRLLEKRKMSPEEAKKRMLAQAPQAEKVKQAQVVIQNDSDIEQTWKQVQTSWNAIIKKLKARAAQNAQEARTEAQDAQTIAKRAPQSTPAPAAPPVEADEDGEFPLPQIDTAGIEVKRGMPGNAEQIAHFITEMSGTATSRMDVMLTFGQKSYLISHDTSENIIGLMGWQVENLITRVDEFYLAPRPDTRAVIHALIRAVETASKELQSEVGFIFLPPDTDAKTLTVFNEHGYHQTTVGEIKIPAWREAVSDAANQSLHILHKPLRKDRVLTPI